MKQFFKKTKIFVVVTVLLGASYTFYSFTDNYFEISKNLEIFNSLFKELNIYYVDETNPGELMKTAIDNMLESLDPYTNYIPESDIEDYRFMTTGQYGGIGALIRKSGEYVMVAEPYEGFPANKAGLLAGDVILEIDGKTTKGKTTGDISKALKGEPNTEVELLIQRPGKSDTFKKKLNREDIKIDDVPYYGYVGDGVGYIKLNSFTETASAQVKNAYEELKKQGELKSLILDLRGNGGGLLREAVNIVNFFVPKGTDVVSTKGKVDTWDRVNKALNTPIDLEVPLAVLIDPGSASASEIVAGSLQDLDRAVLIGQKSFGKGLVQQTRNLAYNSKLKVTIAKYYIPSGRCIQKLDYSHRDEDGEVQAVPDSLIKEFETKNGRKVKDGQGIMPDIELDRKKYSQILSALVSKNLIFDYATDYFYKHPSIAPANEFSLTDEEYKDFMKFLDGKDYNYTTKSEKILEDLEKTAQAEKYFSDVENEYKQLKDKIFHNKSEDLITFKAEIKEQLENEIVSRYYYQKGRIIYSLNQDENVMEAKKLFENKQQYDGILGGTVAKGGSKN